MSNTIATAKQAWLDKRRNYITGTDLAAIMGLSKHGSPITVWLDKKGLKEPQPENNAMRMGLRMEDTILGIYAEETGEPLARAGAYELFTNGIIGATLDATRVNDHRPVDAKNIRHFDPKVWGEAFTSEIPKYYYLQLVAQMMVTNASHADLAVLFSGVDFKPYTIERDLAFEAQVLEYANDWWQKHIVGNVQPEVDGSDSATEWIKQKLARAEKGLVIESTSKIELSVRMLKERKEEIKALEEIKDKIENELKLLIGDAEEVSGVLTWKNNKDTSKTDWEAIAREIAKEELSEKVFAEKISSHTTTKPGARVLRLK